ncbi:unnamed protein product, partial [Vitis vinifera]
MFLRIIRGLQGTRLLLCHHEEAPESSCELD